MRAGNIWTSLQDSKLLSLRAAGTGWSTIALELELGRHTVIERGRRLGARKVPKPRVVMEDRDRPPRSAGHPECWALITNGTVLEGQAYPYPVFL